LANIAFGFILTGIVVRANSKFYSAFSVFVLYFVFFLCAMFSQTFQWERPSYSMGCDQPDVMDRALSGVLNQYAFPDTFFTTNIPFCVFYIYGLVWLEKRPWPILLTVLASIYAVLFCISEVLTARQSGLQMPLNIVLAVLLSVVLILAARKYKEIFPTSEAFFIEREHQQQRTLPTYYPARAPSLRTTRQPPPPPRTPAYYHYTGHVP